MKETIFIGWGGKIDLAMTVGQELEKQGFNVMVGGNMPDSLYVGSYILEQMKRCSRAIILSEQKKDGAIFSQNLLFEWGFLTSKLPSANLHVYLIDTAHKDLPSDLAGFWSTSVKRNNRNNQEIAEEILDNFCAEYSKIRPIDKLEVMHRYQSIRSMIDRFNSEPTCSDNQLAYNILHSIHTSYYYNEVASFNKSLSLIKTNSLVLSRVIQVAMSILNIFEATDNLTKSLHINKYFEASLVLTSDFSQLDNDLDLKRWVKIISLSYLGICNMLLAKSKDTTKDAKKAYYRKAIELSLDAQKFIMEDVEINPQDSFYSQLFVGYGCRDIANSYINIGENFNAKDYIVKTVLARKDFYIHYKQLYPFDKILIDKFSQEYYLGLLEKIQFEDDVIEKDVITKAIKAYLSERERHFVKEEFLLVQMNQIYKALTTKKRRLLLRLPDLLENLNLR